MTTLHTTKLISAKDHLGENQHNPHELQVGDNVCIQFSKLYATELPQKLDNRWFVIEDISKRGIPRILAENKMRKVRPGHVKSIIRHI